MLKTSTLRKHCAGLGEMVESPAAPAENTVWFPTPMWLLTTFRIPSPPLDPEDPFWPPWALHAHGANM